LIKKKNFGFFSDVNFQKKHISDFFPISVFNADKFQNFFRKDLAAKMIFLLFISHELTDLAHFFEWIVWKTIEILLFIDHFPLKILPHFFHFILSMSLKKLSQILSQENIKNVFDLVPEAFSKNDIDNFFPIIEEQLYPEDISDFYSLSACFRYHRIFHYFSLKFYHQKCF